MVDFNDLRRALLALEINTIVSDGIIAERMPDDGRALIRIAQMYKGFLGEVLIELASEGIADLALPDVRLGDGRASSFADWEVASGGMRTFAAIEAAAHACRRARATVPHPNGMRTEHDAILARVAAACSDIMAMLRRMHLGDVLITTTTVDLAEEEGIAWPAFDRDTLLDLQRIWETGVDVIVLQTVVRLDGGVTTRILDGWDGDSAAPLRAAHQQSVAISLDRWNLLVGIARDIAGFFLGGRAQPESVRAPPALADGAAGVAPSATATRVADDGAAG